MPFLRLIQFLARREFRKFFKMLGPQRLGNRVLLVEPLAEINQLAAARTEWPELSSKPIPFPFAGRAFDFQRLLHSAKN
jgi:hypothetical protein